jgi:hypothetical protein
VSVTMSNPFLSDTSTPVEEGRYAAREPNVNVR